MKTEFLSETLVMKSLARRERRRVLKTKGLPDGGFEENLPNAADNIGKMTQTVLNKTNDKDENNKVNQVTQQNMGVKKVRTSEDVKAGNIYYRRGDTYNSLKNEDGSSTCCQTKPTKDTTEY
jgi:hypothetical protein